MANLLSKENSKSFGSAIATSLVVLSIVTAKDALVEWWGFGIFLVCIFTIAWAWKKDMSTVEETSVG